MDKNDREYKEVFEVIVNRKKIKVEFEPNFNAHLAFHGDVSETGYRSDFSLSTQYIGADKRYHQLGYELDDVKKYAQSLARFFHDNKTKDINKLRGPKRPEPLPVPMNLRPPEQLKMKV